VAKSTGPILAAGGITWVNQTLLGTPPNKQNAVENSIRLGLATGVLTAILAGAEKAVPTFAPALAWTALATVLLVRVPDKSGKLQPTPLERILSLF
jgi:hypothetical protein